MAKRIMSMKNSNGTIGNRTRDLPTCSAVPQPTALPRAPFVISGGILFNMLVFGINEMVFVFPLKFQNVVPHFLFTRPIFLLNY